MSWFIVANVQVPKTINNQIDSCVPSILFYIPWSDVYASMVKDLKKSKLLIVEIKVEGNSLKQKVDLFFILILHYCN
jgi:hypothetical protein